MRKLRKALHRHCHAVLARAPCSLSLRAFILFLVVSALLLATDSAIFGISLADLGLTDYPPSPEPPSPEPPNPELTSPGALVASPPSPAPPSPQALETTSVVSNVVSRCSGTAAVGKRAPYRIVVSGRKILINGQPLHLKGVNWSPYPRGGRGGDHPEDEDFRGFAERDAGLMAQAGTFWKHGIFVLNTVYMWGGASPHAALDTVYPTKDHPATLMWVVGNEWNYNKLYSPLSPAEVEARIGEVARLIKERDKVHPVATIHGELPSERTLHALTDIDIWGINTYRGSSFGKLFSQWTELSSKPMFVGEYGLDAYQKEQRQADVVAALTREIVAQSSSLPSQGACFGGFVFEWADEWWKNPQGSPLEHDINTGAGEGGPHPFHEEWFGLVDIDRNPRPSYWRFAAEATPANTASNAIGQHSNASLVMEVSLANFNASRLLVANALCGELEAEVQTAVATSIGRAEFPGFIVLGFTSTLLRANCYVLDDIEGARAADILGNLWVAAINGEIAKNLNARVPRLFAKLGASFQIAGPVRLHSDT